MTVRIYVRASTKDQDAKRALSDLLSFSQSYDDNHVEYVEHFSGTKLDRPALTLLLNDAEEGDILLVESVDRLSRLSQDDFAILKQRIKDKGLRLVVADLPTTHTVSEGMTGDILRVINDMLIDLLRVSKPGTVHSKNRSLELPFFVSFLSLYVNLKNTSS